MRPKLALEAFCFAVHLIDVGTITVACVPQTEHSYKTQAATWRVSLALQARAKKQWCLYSVTQEQQTIQEHGEALLS
jgi:hypothetical protein